ncbi:S-adenosylmethionine synthase [Acrasis kona]|uniref:S-adenosylmethionine synthase n=1 Tax=Acrasis kona TaxID=1008807 RepID=A0AAW2ZFP0_9EUKA
MNYLISSPDSKSDLTQDIDDFVQITREDVKDFEIKEPTASSETIEEEIKQIVDEAVPTQSPTNSIDHSPVIRPPIIYPPNHSNVFDVVLPENNNFSLKANTFAIALIYLVAQTMWCVSSNNSCII